MVYFQTKIPILVYFLYAFEWKIWVYFKAVLVLLSPIGVFYLQWKYSVIIWCIFSNFGMLEKEKSGNSGANGQ
jgi:hypothetical protein